MTDGAMGEQPDWYPLIVAARAMGVAPWELHAQPVFWTEVGLAYQQAELALRRHQMKSR